MKLLQINTVANSGSTGKIAEDIGKIMIAEGWESYIAYGRGTPQSESELIRIGDDKNFKLNALKARLFDNEGLNSVNATKAFIDKINEIKPDILHLHNIHGYYLNYRLLFKWMNDSGIPVVWTLHDCWPFTGHCAYFDMAGCEKWKMQCESCVIKNEYPSSFFFDNSRRNYLLKKETFTNTNNLTLVPVSRWLQNLVRDSFLSEYPSVCIHNGIKTELFKPYPNSGEEIRKKYNITSKRILLGVAAPFGPRKGFYDFIKLSKILNSDDYAIVLVGLSEKQLSRLPDGIIGIARTENQIELAKLYSAADIFLNLTYEDNYPTTNLEAIACGTPVITYNTGGSPESISESTGLVIEKGNMQQIVGAIETLSNKGLSKECRDFALKNFDKNKCFFKYKDLYKSLVK